MTALTFIRLMLFMTLSSALLFITYFSLFYAFPFAQRNGVDFWRVLYSIVGTVLFMIVGTVVFGYLASLIARLNPLGEKAKSVLMPIPLLFMAYTLYRAYLLTYAYGYYVNWAFYFSVGCLIFAFTFVSVKIYKMLMRGEHA